VEELTKHIMEMAVQNNLMTDVYCPCLKSMVRLDSSIVLNMQ